MERQGIFKGLLTWGVMAGWLKAGWVKAGWVKAGWVKDGWLTDGREVEGWVGEGWVVDGWPGGCAVPVPAAPGGADDAPSAGLAVLGLLGLGATPSLNTS